jgi:hypothetical protein
MAHVKHKNGRFCVNRAPGGVSYITLTSTDNDFTDSTEVETVQDTDNGLEWEPEIVARKPGELRVRLTAGGAPAPAAKGKKKVTTDAPDGGNLTVTITSPVKTVDPIPVDYVSDPPPP